MTEIEHVGFDYADLLPQDAAAARDAVVRIRLRTTGMIQHIIEVGQDLIDVKKRIGHGKFLKWMDAEFKMTERTAQRFMAVAEKFGAKYDIVSDLSPTVLYELAAPSTPDETIDEIVEQARAGKRVTVAEVKKLKKDIKAAREEARGHKSHGDELTADLRKMQDQITALKSELADGKSESPEVRSRLMAVWNETPEPDRAWFLDRVSKQPIPEIAAAAPSAKIPAPERE